MMRGPNRVEPVTGPLTLYAVGFQQFLITRGYSLSAVRLRLWQLDHVSRWLLEQHLMPGELTDERAEAFVLARRAVGYRSWVSLRSMALPMDYLRGIGVVPPVQAPTLSPVEQVIDAYRGYLVSERGLTEKTVRYYASAATLFPSTLPEPHGRQLTRLDAAQVMRFLSRECARRSVASAKYLVAGLRSVLRYLYVQGWTVLDLAQAVPGVAARRGGSLPRGLAADQAVRLLASCDRNRPVGLRDFAILTVLLRLGMRCAEVAALTLDDIDWHRGEILLRGKGNVHERLPLPADVGEALVAYLQDGREPCTHRSLFVRVKAPNGGLAATAVTAVVHDACVRAGMDTIGAHRLRHTVGTQLLQAGASLPEVAQVLRHRTLDTTSRYAKVDRVALRELARPWPGSAS